MFAKISCDQFVLVQVYYIHILTATPRYGVEHVLRHIVRVICVCSSSKGVEASICAHLRYDRSAGPLYTISYTEVLKLPPHFCKTLCYTYNYQSVVWLIYLYLDK